MKWRTFFKLVGILFQVLFVSTLFAQKNTTAINIHNAFNLAAQFNKQFQYDSAINQLKNILIFCKSGNFKKEEADAYDLLAEIMQTNGKLQQMQKYDSLILPIITQLKDTPLLINTYNRIGIYNMENGKNKEAEQNFITILNLGLNKQASAKTAEVNSNLGSLYLGLGDKDKAIASFFTALKLYEKNNNALGIGETNSNISSVYYLMGKIQDAINYQKISIEIREKLNDKKGLIITNTNIGQLYILNGNNLLALQHLQKSVQLAEQLNNPKLLAAAYSAMSAYNNRNKNYKEALFYQTKAITLFEEINDKPMLSRLYVSAANLSNATNDSLAALTFFEKALILSKNLGNKENVGNVYEKMSSFYLSRKDYEKAHNTYKIYIAYKDSISEKSSFFKIEEIRSKYDIEKKDNEINKLTAFQTLKQLQIEKQDALLSGNLIESQKKQAEIELLFKEKELQDFKLDQQDEEITKQSLSVKNNQQQLLLFEKEKLLQEQQLKTEKIIKYLLFAGLGIVLLFSFILFNRFKLKKKIQQQAELLTIRNGISQNLHDEIGSTITSINILSNVSQQAMDKEPSQAKEMLSQIAIQSRQIQQNMSDIVWSIRPENEKLENLLVRMKEYVTQTLEPLQINTTFNFNEQLTDIVLPINYRKEVLLIFKEAVNNIAKHANASVVTISIRQTKNNLMLSIADNGQWKGDNSGTGTKSMQHRAGVIGGTLAIDKATTGTTVLLQTNLT